MKLLKNNKGSTSVLIIMLMVVLMMFGVAILTTTLSNRKLSEKKQEWVHDYYQLESEAALKLAELDTQLQMVKNEAAEGDSLEAMTALYLEGIKGLYPVLEKRDADYYISFSVTRPYGEYNKYIDVEVRVRMPKDFEKTAFLNSGNYEIVLYRESQDLFEYEDIEFGVPFAPNER